MPMILNKINKTKSCENIFCNFLQKKTRVFLAPFFERSDPPLKWEKKFFVRLKIWFRFKWSRNEISSEDKDLTFLGVCRNPMKLDLGCVSSNIFEWLGHSPKKWVAPSCVRAPCHCYPLLKVIIGSIPFFLKLEEMVVEGGTYFLNGSPNPMGLSLSFALYCFEKYYCSFLNMKIMVIGIYHWKYHTSNLSSK